MRTLEIRRSHTPDGQILELPDPRYDGFPEQSIGCEPATWIINADADVRVGSRQGNEPLVVLLVGTTRFSIRVWRMLRYICDIYPDIGSVVGDDCGFDLKKYLETKIPESDNIWHT
jgi:hypothetical protein